MNKKAGRNDPCPCGSGKKHKQCCWGKEVAPRRIKATWVNAPAKEVPNLFDRAFADTVKKMDEKPPTPPKSYEMPS